jgi:hypothetical protein
MFTRLQVSIYTNLSTKNPLDGNSKRWDLSRTLFLRIPF